MVETRYEFNSRLRTLGRKHRALERGSKTHVRKDGLIVVRPARRRARRNSPLRIIVILVAFFFAFKGFMLASMGVEGYSDRVTRLEAGTSLEQVGASVMQADRVSLMLANAWAGLLSE